MSTTSSTSGVQDLRAFCLLLRGCGDLPQPYGPCSAALSCFCARGDQFSVQCLQETHTYWALSGPHEEPSQDLGVGLVVARPSRPILWAGQLGNPGKGCTGNWKAVPYFSFHYFIETKF